MNPCDSPDKVDLRPLHARDVEAPKAGCETECGHRCEMGRKICQEAVCLLARHIHAAVLRLPSPGDLSHVHDLKPTRPRSRCPALSPGICKYSDSAAAHATGLAKHSSLTVKESQSTKVLCI